MFGKISGLKGDLTQVRWQRFASGLHEPLSLCIRDDQLFVFDRNGIWRLNDEDGDGETDVYELFSNCFTQTAETREFATSMKPAPDGDLYNCKGGQQSSSLGKHNGIGIARLPRREKMLRYLGWGLRHHLYGVQPQPVCVTASDQQGNYVPQRRFILIGDHQYYGFL
jgi:glucose/arabinose dehydrogenase